MHTQQKSVSVAASLRAFIAHLIDYAGLFPPASLPLSEAIQNYAKYRHDPDRWMLSRFIVPATQLPELSAAGGRLFTGFDPFVFTILGRGGRDHEEFLSGLYYDLLEANAFIHRHDNGAAVDMIEVRLPPSVTASKDADVVGKLLAKASEQINSADLRPFYEVAFDSNWESSVSTVVQAIAVQNASGNFREAGFKLRCGGTDAAAFPTPGQIAHAISTCHEFGVAMKATAGLHHPVRHYSNAVQTKMHGFFNVFIAGILADAHSLDRERLTAILEDEDARNFSFGEDALAWCDVMATTAQIDAARQRAMISYGSCSFDEPREDLDLLGLIKR